MDPIKSLIEEVADLSLDSTRTQSPSPGYPWTKEYLKTGLVYDDFMAKHECLWTKSDECPQRYLVVRDRFKHYNLIDQCHIIPTKMAAEEQVLLLHDKSYYDLVKSTKGETNQDRLKMLSQKFDGIYFNEFTYDNAMMALGSSIELANSVIDQRIIKNGFALIRTPGHHSQKAEANGFCFFNNAAIVAKHAIENRGLKRVLIIDWDVHHGQGTQSFFYDNDQVLYISIHRYEKGKFWPELIESNFNFNGSNSGEGFNINIPLNETGCNDGDFLTIWFNVIMPVAYDFDPELVIISAGFDAAIGCPEGKMRVKPITYHILTHSLMSLADGKVVALLEGGYNLVSLAESAAMTMRALLGYPCPKLDHEYIELTPHESVVHSVLSSIWAIRPKWNLLKMQGEFERFHPELRNSPGGDEMTRRLFSPVSTYEGTSGLTKPDIYDLEGVCCVKNVEEQEALAKEINYIISKQDLSTPINALSKRTLLIFDDDMTAHKCETSHPERPARYTTIKNKLQEVGLMYRCTIGKSRHATEDEVALAHERSYINELKETKSMTKEQLKDKAKKLDSIYFNKSSYDCALLAVGCTLEAIDQVMKRNCSNAFALIRPPGHHASAHEASGFCLFNNVVVGAKYALKNYPEACKRVLIVDYDYHHGNGVQTMVQDDERIMYISIHAYDDAQEYPCQTISNYQTGSKRLINIPWNDDKMGNSEYLLAFLNLVLPTAYEFNPDLVLVSSGFDAVANDLIGKYNVSPAAYGHFIHHLLPLASGKLVACLEGGYKLESISQSAAHVVSILAGDTPTSIKLKPPHLSSIITLKNVISYHKADYKLLCLDYDLPMDQIN